MKDFLEFLVTGIVKNADQVYVTEEQQPDNFINLKLSVSKEDMGLVIGKEGRTIKSLRNLLKAKASKENIRVNLELSEEN